MSKLLLFLLLLIASHRLQAQDSLEVISAQKEVFEKLSMAHTYNGVFKSSSSLYHYGKQYYAEQSKQKLLSILRNQWTEEEKLSIAKEEVNRIINQQIKNCEVVTSDSQFYQTKRKYWLLCFRKIDSLKALQKAPVYSLPPYQTELQKVIDYLESRVVPDSYIYVSAMLEDERFNQLLRNVLTDSVHYNNGAIRLALARLGIQPYKAEEIKKFSITIPHKPLTKDGYYDVLTDVRNRTNALAYICNQESILEISKWLNMTGKEYQYERISHSDIYVPVAYNALEILKDIILNEDFLLHFSKRKGIEKSDYNFAKKWLTKNYGKYQLNRDYYPQDLDWKLLFPY